jgi:hypothetical protein
MPPVYTGVAPGRLADMTSTCPRAVPAYWATGANGNRVPFIVSLLLYDHGGRARITPAVERSIDKTIELTGRAVLATGTVADDEDMAASVGRWVERALAMPDVIILFRCQGADCAERLMNYLHGVYALTLVREA